MNKILIAFMIIFTLSSQIVAKNICNQNEKKVAFLFFNGINNSKKDVRDAIDEFKAIYGDKTSQGDTIIYDKMYNTSEDMLHDIFETFSQKLEENDEKKRYETFYLLENSSLSGLLRRVPWIEEYIKKSETITKEILEKMIKKLGQSNQMQVDYANHRTSMQKYINEGYKMLLVAHSQGNLFANKAYNYAKNQIGKNGSNNPSDSIKVVHIAPASSVLHGEYILSNLDWIIRSVVSHSPNVTYPAIQLLTDPSGHELINTYLNPKRAGLSKINSEIKHAFSSLISPPKLAHDGFLTATLTWNGSGDVDLHVYEPNGSHVYFRNYQGVSGYLDVDNTISDGPEHYYITCDSQNITEGIYTFKVANYARANGKVATVQIDLLNGEKQTKSVALTNETGSTPGAKLFSLKVQKDKENIQATFL